MGWLSGFLSSRSYTKGMTAADRARDAGRLDDAASLYGLLAARFPDDAGLLVLSGNMFKDTGRYADARVNYAAAIVRDPGGSDAHLQFGHLAKLEGNLEEALLHYRKAASLDPDRPDASDELRALEPLMLNSLTVYRFDTSNLFLACGGPSSVLFERMKVAFASKPH